MSDLYSNKNLAGIGALLLIFSPIPGIGLFLGVAGVILLLIGVKRLSEHYQESSMYHNMMLGVVFFIIGLVAITVGAATIYAYTALISLITAILSNLILITGVLIITFLFYLLSAIYFKRAFTKFAQKTRNQMFNTSGLILFIGAILTILFGLGLVLILIAWIMAAVAFFSIKSAQQPSYPVTPSTAPPKKATRHCPNCGSSIQPYAAFCPNCGKQLST